ncbi:hypothetical protein ACLOJK_013611 [Asimina triloba]
MEIVIPAAAGDFHFDSTSSSPFISAPTSPKGFGDFYFSAPTSPSRAATIYAEFNSSLSSIPFDWEEKPGTPKSTAPNNDDDAFPVANNEDEDADDDFAFDFSGQLEKPPLTAAEELFDGGKIRPLQPPPRLQSPASSPKSPKRIFRNAFSPKAKKDFDPFAAALEETRKGSMPERGRERVPATNPSHSVRRASRSHSPFREPEPKLETPSSSALKSGNSSKKWRLKDLLLFRSASEGSSTDKDPLRKYRLLPPMKGREDVKNVSFRSTDSGGSVSGSSRRGGRVSAHELHYTANRAVSDERRRKTFLPYKQGLLGCIGFNPTAQGIANGFNSFTRV